MADPPKGINIRGQRLGCIAVLVENLYFACIQIEFCFFVVLMDGFDRLVFPAVNAQVAAVHHWIFQLGAVDRSTVSS